MNTEEYPCKWDFQNCVMIGNADNKRLFLIAIDHLVFDLSLIQNNLLHVFLGWPAFHQSTVHSSPLLYDIDKDGVREIALATYNGEVLFFR